MACLYMHYEILQACVEHGMVIHQTTGMEMTETTQMTLLNHIGMTSIIKQCRALKVIMRLAHLTN